jgi:hypothetical protein
MTSEPDLEKLDPVIRYGEVFLAVVVQVLCTCR